MLKDFPKDTIVYVVDSETVPDILALIDALSLNFQDSTTYENVIERFKKERFGADAKDPMLPLAFQQIVALPALRFHFSTEGSAGAMPDFNLINFISKPLPKNLPHASGNKVQDRLEWLLEGLKIENSALSAFMASIIDDQEAGHQVALITWNGHGFDEAVFLMRANRRFPASLESKVPLDDKSLEERAELHKKFFKRAEHRSQHDLWSRFSPLNIDLMKVIAGEHAYSARTRQSDFASLQGLPGKIKGPDDSVTMDGSQVASMYFHSTRQRQRIIDYGSHDVLTLALLFINTMESFGMIDHATRNFYFTALVAYVEKEVKANKSKKQHPFKVWLDDLKRLNPHGF